MEIHPITQYYNHCKQGHKMSQKSSIPIFEAQAKLPQYTVDSLSTSIFKGAKIVTLCIILNCVLANIVINLGCFYVTKCILCSKVKETIA